MPRPPRQDGLFAPNLFFQLFLTAQPVAALIEQAIAPTRLAASAYAVLSAIDELAPVKPSEVARVTGVPRPSLTRHINALVRGGHVRRIPHTTDGRSYTLVLTPRGARTMQTAGRALGSALVALRTAFGADLAPLTRSLADLREAAETALRSVE